MKKTILIIIICVLLSLGFVIFYYFNNTLSCDELSTKINESLKQDVQILDSTIIDNEIFYLISDLKDEHIGFAVFKLKLFNRYSLIRSGISYNRFYTTDYFIIGENNTKKATILIGGKNPNGVISYFTAIVANQLIKVPIGQDHFLKVYKAQFSKEEPIQRLDINFFDDKNNNITENLRNL